MLKRSRHRPRQKIQATKPRVKSHLLKIKTRKPRGKSLPQKVKVEKSDVRSKVTETETETRIMQIEPEKNVAYPHQRAIVTSLSVQMLPKK
ncbi:hypothetical protein OROGR_024652 [Orobanche gracilis]